MAPVSRGYCKYESLISGAITMWDIALCNDHLAVVAENQRRMNDKGKRA